MASDAAAMPPPSGPMQTPRRPTASATGTTPFRTPHRTPGEQTSHTPVVDFAAIEYQKENVQPSFRGRSAHSLSQTLGLQHKERATDLAKRRAEFEARVEPAALSESDDPLSIWEDYVDWVIESYPSGAHSVDSGLVPLLERATRAIKDDERYRDAATYRYLRLWLLYSRNVECPDLVINWLLANDVGTACAALYEEGASVAEGRGLYESADALFRLGISRGATPLPRLKRRYAEYQARIVRTQSSSSDAGSLNGGGGGGLSYHQALQRAMRESRRTMLGNKDTRSGTSLHANAVRGGGRNAGLGGLNATTTPNNGRKLAIFKDADGSAASSSTRGPAMSDVLPSRDARRQENTKDAKPWGGERLLQSGVRSGSSSSSKAPMKIFHDSDDEQGDDDQEEAVSPVKRGPLFGAVKPKPKLGSQCPESDLLKKDPFRLWDAAVQADAQALRGCELGNVRDVKMSSEFARRNAAAAAAASKSKQKPKPTSTSKSSSSAARAPSASTSASSSRRPERLVLPEALLYPNMDITLATQGQKVCTAEQSVEEIMARRGGWALEGEGDPWCYLDEVVGQDQVQGEEEEEVQMDLDVPPPAEVSAAQSPPATTTTTTKRPRISSGTPTRSSIKRLPPTTTIPTEPTKTLMTKAAEEEVRALFNGSEDEDSDEEESDDDSSDESEEEEEEEADDSLPSMARARAQARARAASAAATADENAHASPNSNLNDENALARTPLRAVAAQAERRPLGAAPAPVPARAVLGTPMRKPLGGLSGGLGGVGVGSTPLGGGKRGVFVEEEEAEDQEDEGEAEAKPKPQAQARRAGLVSQPPRFGAMRAHPLAVAADEDEEEESASSSSSSSEDEDEDDAQVEQQAHPHARSHARKYDFSSSTSGSASENPGARGEASLILARGARYEDLTTISERTEVDTRWGLGVATPGRSRSVVWSGSGSGGQTLAEGEDEEGEEGGEGEMTPNSECKNTSKDTDTGSTTPSRSDSRSQMHTHLSTGAGARPQDRDGGTAQFSLSPGYTIERRHDDEEEEGEEGEEGKWSVDGAGADEEEEAQVHGPEQVQEANVDADVDVDADTSMQDGQVDAVLGEGAVEVEEEEEGADALPAESGSGPVEVDDLPAASGSDAVEADAVPSDSVEAAALPATSGSDSVEAAPLPPASDSDSVSAAALPAASGSDSVSAIASTSSSSIPNPCNPTSPHIISTILSTLALPVESSPDYMDRTSQASQRLPLLKRRFPTSTGSSAASASAPRKSVAGGGAAAEEYTMELDGFPFAVRALLGEGAYGSVFLVEDVQNCAPRRKIRGGIDGDSSFSQHAGDDDGDDDSDDDSDSDSSIDEEEAERARMLAIKVESPPNKWEFYILGQLRARLPQRALSSIISARRFYAFGDESLLLLEWGEKGTLLEMVNSGPRAGISPPVVGGAGAGGSAGGATMGVGVEEVLALFFTIELLRLVEALHEAGLLHGDLKIDNCLLRLDDDSGGATSWSNAYQRDGSQGWASKGLYLLDFGRAIDLNAPALRRGQAQPQQQQQQQQQEATSTTTDGSGVQSFIADWQDEADARDCREMREGKPWRYEVDYHGVASIAHVLLFGKYIEVEIGADDRQRIKAPLKRYWQQALWNRFFDVLLNPRAYAYAVGGDGSAPLAHPITHELAACRTEMEDWLEENCNRGGKNLKGLLKKLEIWSMRGGK